MTEQAATIGIGLMLVGLVEIAIGTYFWLRGRRSTAWPTASGRITQAQVASTRDSEGRTLYYPDIRYSYDVDGTTYQGNRLRAGSRAHLATQDAARQTVERFTGMSDVLVYYDPANPQNAALSVGITWWLVWAMWAMGAAFLAAGAIALFIL